MWKRCLGGLLVFFCAPVLAQSTAFKLIDGSLDATSRAVRAYVAGDLLKQISVFADLVPTPRPADISWAEAERAAIDRLASSEPMTALSRHEQTVQSPDFQNVRLYRTLKEARSSLECVLEPHVPLRREMACWATAALPLGDSLTYSQAIKALRKSNRLPDHSSLVEAEHAYPHIARGIQQYVVLPYLRNEIKQ